MKIFVINLEKSTHRRADIEKNLGTLDLDFDIITAIDGYALSKNEKQEKTRSLSYALTAGEIGCALSHINIYRKIFAEKIGAALILEDDALVTPDIKLALPAVEQFLCVDKPYVILLTETSKIIKNKYRTLDSGHTLNRVLEAVSTRGYVINYAAAKSMMSFLYPVWLVADKWNLIYEYGVCDVMALTPQLILKSEHEKNSTIQIYNGKESQDLRNEKNIVWEKIKNNRNIKTRIRMFKIKVINAFSRKAQS